MRRVLSTLLLLALSLPLFASAFADAQTQRSVPLCCRKGGLHHCMGTVALPNGAPAFRAVCAAFPHSTSSVPATRAMLLPQSLSWAGYAAAIMPAATGDDGYRVRLFSPRWQRGPPASLFIAE